MRAEGKDVRAGIAVAEAARVRDDAQGHVAGQFVFERQTGGQGHIGHELGGGRRLGLHPVCQTAHAVPAQMVVDVHAGEARQAIGKFTAQAVGFAAVQQQGATGRERQMPQAGAHRAGQGEELQVLGQAGAAVEYEFLAHGAQDMPGGGQGTHGVAVGVDVAGHQDAVHAPQGLGHTLRAVPEERGNQFSLRHKSPPGCPPFPRSRPLPSSGRICPCGYGGGFRCWKWKPRPDAGG